MCNLKIFATTLALIGWLLLPENVFQVLDESIILKVKRSTKPYQRAMRE